jgi:hypothetical protein
VTSTRLTGFVTMTSDSAARNCNRERSKAMRFSRQIKVWAHATGLVVGCVSMLTAQTPIPDELKQLYAENSSFISDQIKIAEDVGQPAAKRIDAFELLRSRFPRAALDPAVKLASDPNADVAVEGVAYLSSVVVMMNHGPSLDSHGDHGSNDPIMRAVNALRTAVSDDRREVREVAAASLASLNDEPAIKTVKQSVDQGRMQDTEALRYMTLSKQSVAAPYVADFLGSGSTAAQSEAISYLGTSPEYRVMIRDSYLKNQSAPVELRTAAASVLAKTDPEIGTYAPGLVADPSLPTAVFNGLISNIDTKQSPSVIERVFKEAAESQAGTKDTAKTASIVNSLERVQSLRPDLKLDSISASVRSLKTE